MDFATIHSRRFPQSESQATCGNGLPLLLAARADVCCADESGGTALARASHLPKFLGFRHFLPFAERNIFHFALLVLKGIYHCWKYLHAFQGAEANGSFLVA